MPPPPFHLPSSSTCVSPAGSDVNGSIMLTASHMPYQNNGMKFFTAEGGLAKPDITAILTAAAEKAAASGVELGDDMQVCCAVVCCSCWLHRSSFQDPSLWTLGWRQHTTSRYVKARCMHGTNFLA